MRVIVSRDGRWRIEPSRRLPGCFDVYSHGALRLERVGMDRVAQYLIEHGIDPDRDLVED